MTRLIDTIQVKPVLEYTLPVRVDKYTKSLVQQVAKNANVSQSELLRRIVAYGLKTYFTEITDVKEEKCLKSES